MGEQALGGQISGFVARMSATVFTFVFLFASQCFTKPLLDL
jgi:hypothetical protein